MTTRIGIVADVHCAPQPLAEAIDLFRERGVDSIFCAGDIAGYGGELEATVELLQQHDCRAVYGNHELRYLECNPETRDSPVSRFFRELPATQELEIEGRSVYMVHASPPQDVLDGISLLDENGEVIEVQKQYWTQRLADFSPEVLVVGHTHQVFAERLGDTLVVNPGSSRFNHSCMVLSFPELEAEVLPLSGRDPIRAWHWKGKH